MHGWSGCSWRVEHSWPDWGRRSLVLPSPMTTGEPQGWEKRRWRWAKSRHWEPLWGDPSLVQAREQLHVVRTFVENSKGEKRNEFYSYPDCFFPVQELVWEDSLRRVKFLFQAKSDSSSVVGRGLDILCTSKTQALIDHASDEWYYSCVIYQGTPSARGFPRTLTARNAFWLKQALISSHIGTVCTNKYSLPICGIGMRSRDRETSCLKPPGHCTTPVCTVKVPEAYQCVKASVLCVVQTTK